MTAMPFSFPIFKAFTTTGTLGPLAGGLLHTFEAGTSTPLAVYQDAALTVPHTNPVVLDSNGQATIYLGPNAYKMRLEDSMGAVQPGWPIDGIEDPLDNAKDYTDTLRSDLAASSGSSLVGFLQSGAGVAARTLQDKGRDFVSATDYSTVEAAFAACAALGASALDFPPGDYNQTAGVTLGSNTRITGRGARILVADTVTGPAWLGSAVENVIIDGVHIEGSGTAYTDGSQSHIKLVNSTNCKIADCEFEKSRNHGITMEGCIYVTIDNCYAHHNYGIGYSDKIGTNNILVNSKGAFNGDTGTVVAPAGGRGALLWMCDGSIVDNCVFKNNVEYGFRLYSQLAGTADTVGNNDISVSNIILEDNGNIDFYVYNESELTNNIRIENVGIKRTTNPTTVGFSFQGNGIVANNCSYVKSGAFGTSPAAALFLLSNSELSNFYIENTSSAVSSSGTEAPVNVTLKSWKCNGVATFISVTGTGTKIDSCELKHGGVGATDIAINAVSASVDIVNTKFEGFYRNVSWAAQAMRICGCSCFGTTDVALRMNGDGLQTLVAYGNNWSSVPNPSILGPFERQNSYGRAQSWSGAVPAALTWVRGDIVWNRDAAASGFIGWVCVTSGTPGTWKTFGAITA